MCPEVGLGISVKRYVPVIAPVNAPMKVTRNDAAGGELSVTVDIPLLE